MNDKNFTWTNPHQSSSNEQTTSLSFSKPQDPAFSEISSSAMSERTLFPLVPLNPSYIDEECGKKTGNSVEVKKLISNDNTIT